MFFKIMYLLFFVSYFSTSFLFCNDNKYSKKIKLINLNKDLTVDTIIGVMNNANTIQLKQIYWGKDTTNGIPPNRKVKMTKFEYPDWKKLKVKSFFYDFNQDSSYDILLTIGGKLVKNNTKKDTSISFILFGRRGLDTIGTMKFKNLKRDSINTSEIIFVKSSDLFSEFQIGDISGKPIYKFNNNKNRNPIVIPVLVEEKLSNNISIYPNPTNEKIIINTNELEGDLMIDILNLNGEIIITKSLKINYENSKSEFLLSSFASGIYIVSLTLNQKQIYSTKIIKIN